MLANRSMPPSTVIPELVYEDVGEAVAWLCDTFGFTGRWRAGSHRAQLAFTGGLLRCHRSTAMTPRTDPDRRGGLYQVYVGAGRGQHGLDYCDQRPIDRTVIDEAMPDELGRSYLDLAETRRRLEEKMSADLTIAQAAAAEADAEAQRAEARLGRVQRAFQDGHLEPEDYADQRAQLIQERSAAQAAANRATDHIADLRTAGPLADADEAVLRHLADMRKAVTEGVDRAPDLNALRTILRQLFSKVVLVPEGHEWLDLSGVRESSASIPGARLLPFLREDAIAEVTAGMRNVPRRASLPLETEHDALLIE
jgi:hypothetical protein